MKNSLLCLPVIMLSLSSCAVSNPGSPKGAAKPGMTKEEVASALGTPGYKYAINQQETWIYTLTNPVTSRVKTTALNMVPMAGPVITLIGSLKPAVNNVKSAITFGKDQKVTRIEESKEAAPAAKLKLETPKLETPKVEKPRLEKPKQ